jgi:hypothetical protein
MVLHRPVELAALTGQVKWPGSRNSEFSAANLFAGLRSFFVLEKLHKNCQENRKPRVPDTFQLGAILTCSAFLASRKVNNLRVFNNPEYSDSPRLHLKARVANRAAPIRYLM